MTEWDQDSHLFMFVDVLVQRPLILESPLTVLVGTLELLLLHHVHGAGGEQHGAAAADVRLVCVQHDVGAVPVPEHDLAREPLYQDLGDVLPVGPSDQLLLGNALTD